MVVVAAVVVVGFAFTRHFISVAAQYLLGVNTLIILRAIFSLFRHNPILCVDGMNLRQRQREQEKKFMKLALMQKLLGFIFSFSLSSSDN